MFLIRDLRMKNVEIFRIYKERFGDTIGVLGIIDFKRPSTLDDFPYLRGIEDEKTFGEKNFIKAILLSQHKIQDFDKENVLNILDGFIGEKEGCGWNVDFLNTNIDIDELTISEILLYFKEILEKKYNYILNLDNLNKEAFKYLSQD